jgi:hypothetical protein
MPALNYYDLERYLFGEVHDRFHRDHELGAFDFFSIIIWKANRAKSKIARKLLTARPCLGLDATCRELTRGLWDAPDAKARLCLLRLPAAKGGWEFFLPTASAVLTVLWPEVCTVYDERVRGQLDERGLGDFKDLGNIVGPDRLWFRYEEFVRAVHAAVPGNLPLRDKDRTLFGRSLAEQLERDIKSGFASIAAGESQSF